jgi:hypothetical protein
MSRGVDWPIKPEHSPVIDMPFHIYAFLNLHDHAYLSTNASHEPNLCFRQIIHMLLLPLLHRPQHCPTSASILSHLPFLLTSPSRPTPLLRLLRPLAQLRLQRVHILRSPLPLFPRRRPSLRIVSLHLCDSYNSVEQSLVACEADERVEVTGGLFEEADGPVADRHAWLEVLEVGVI